MGTPGQKLPQVEGMVSAKGRHWVHRGHLEVAGGLVQREQGTESWRMRSDSWVGVRAGKAKTYGLYKLSGFMMTRGCSGHPARVMV